MPDGLYERDVLTWADTQTALLRRLAAGELVNALVDWPNVIEEIQDLGLSELRACRSLMLQAARHILKLHAWPESQAVRHWRYETAAFLIDARRSYTASMRQRLVITELYGDAIAAVRSLDDLSGPPRTLPDDCPFTLEDMLAADVARLLAKVEAGAARNA